MDKVEYVCIQEMTALLSYLLCNNNAHFAPSTHCTFCVEQMVKKILLCPFEFQLVTLQNVEK